MCNPKVDKNSIEGKHWLISLTEVMIRGVIYSPFEVQKIAFLEKKPKPLYSNFDFGV